MACFGDDDAVVHRLEGREVIKALVKTPCERSRRERISVTDRAEDADECKENILPEDREDLALLVGRMKESLLLRLVILAHQAPCSQVGESEGSSVHSGDGEAAEKPIPEDDILNGYRDHPLGDMKCIHKYWDAEGGMWGSLRVGE